MFYTSYLCSVALSSFPVRSCAILAIVLHAFSFCALPLYSFPLLLFLVAYFGAAFFCIGACQIVRYITFCGIEPCLGPPYTTFCPTACPPCAFSWIVPVANSSPLPTSASFSTSLTLNGLALKSCSQPKLHLLNPLCQWLSYLEKLWRFWIGQLSKTVIYCTNWAAIVLHKRLSMVSNRCKHTVWSTSAVDNGNSSCSGHNCNTFAWH